ncbi:MAG: YkgJ family cysteine cluster protein [Lachnospiraceae bacterium]
MLRDIDLSKVSDGKFYTCNDMVKTDCQGCAGCSECCHGMGTSVILDPYDIYQLTTGLSKTFEELLTGPLELNVVDGIILPNLKMCGENEACAFLNSEGRCSIHAIRPGFCRLFPLGRYYENESFRYFLQIHECPKPNKSKIKIKKWLGIENLKQYEEFTIAWHYFLKEKQEIAMNSDSADVVKELSMEILRKYYMYPYKKNIDFYTQFAQIISAQ